MPNIRASSPAKLDSCHHSGGLNLELAPRFFNTLTPVLECKRSGHVSFNIVKVKLSGKCHQFVRNLGFALFTPGESFHGAAPMEAVRDA